MQKVNVMIVDDNMVVRSKYKKILSSSTDLSITEAENGQTAVTKAKAEKPDIVIMDYMMPVMNGLKASQQLIMMYPDVVIIVSTGLEKKELTEAMLNAGAVMLMHKPISKNLLKLTIENFADIIRQKKIMNERQGSSISSRTPMNAPVEKEKETAKQPELKDTGQWKKTLSPEQKQKLKASSPTEKPLTKIEQRLMDVSTEKGITSKEFTEKYMQEYEEEIKEIIDACETLDNIVIRFSKDKKKEQTQEFKKTIGTLSKTINIFREFPSIIYALNSIQSFIDHCDFKVMCKSDTSCRLADIFSEVNDLIQRWKDTVLVEQNTDNVNFMDNLILVYSLQLDTLIDNMR